MGHQSTSEKSVCVSRSDAVRQLDALVFYGRGDRGGGS